MRVRDAVLCFQETQSSDAATKTIDLDLVDPVSALVFQFQATNGTTNNQNNPLHRCITKIEVVDGSDVLASMSFEEAQALEFYKTGKQPMLRIDEGPSMGDVIGCQLLFGRYLYDQEYAMNFARFKNPQLKITWNLAAIRAVSATTAWATGTFKISATAKTMEEMAAIPSKFLMDKQIDSWTGGASGDRRKELPTDYIYRMLMLRSYLTVCDVSENITHVKLSADTDKFIAVDRDSKEFDSEMARLFGNTVVWKRGHYCHNDQVWVPINREPQLKFTVPTIHYLASYGWAWSGEFAAFLSDTAGGTVGADTRVDIGIEGHALHATLPIPLGDINKPETWFNPATYKKLELVLTEAGAAANSIVTEQIRPL